MSRLSPDGYQVTHFVRVLHPNGSQQVFPIMAPDRAAAAESATRYGDAMEIEVWDAGEGPFPFARITKPVTE